MHTEPRVARVLNQCHSPRPGERRRSAAVSFLGLAYSVFRNRTTITILALVVFAITSIWSSSLSSALALTSAAVLVLYLYLVRLVVPLVKTQRLQSSMFDLYAVVVSFVLLVAHRRAPDALVALGLWPCTLLTFHVRPVDGPKSLGMRRTLFWANLNYLVLAMLYSGFFSLWLTWQWPFYQDRRVEPPVLVFMLTPAVLTMMTIQQDLDVNFLHPSLFVGVLVSIATAAFVATITSWATSVAAFKLCHRSSVSLAAENGGRTNG